jgi:hypothetical protein
VFFETLGKKVPCHQSESLQTRSPIGSLSSWKNNVTSSSPAAATGLSPPRSPSPAAQPVLTLLTFSGRGLGPGPPLLILSAVAGSGSRDGGELDRHGQEPSCRPGRERREGTVNQCNTRILYMKFSNRY